MVFVGGQIQQNYIWCIQGIKKVWYAKLWQKHSLFKHEIKSHFRIRLTFLNIFLLSFRRLSDLGKKNMPTA